MGAFEMTEASIMLRELSLPWDAGERMKSVLARVSKACGLTYWRTSDLWYQKARRVEEYELQQIREALQAKREKAARNEIHELKLRLTKLEASLASKDSEFYRPDIDFYRAMFGQPGRTNSALDNRLDQNSADHGFDPPTN